MPRKSRECPGNDKPKLCFPHCALTLFFSPVARLALLDAILINLIYIFLSSDMHMNKCYSTVGCQITTGSGVHWAVFCPMPVTTISIKLKSELTFCNDLAEDSCFWSSASSAVTWQKTFAVTDSEMPNDLRREEFHHPIQRSRDVINLE